MPDVDVEIIESFKEALALSRELIEERGERLIKVVDVIIKLESLRGEAIGKGDCDLENTFNAIIGDLKEAINFQN